MLLGPAPPAGVAHKFSLFCHSGQGIAERERGALAGIDLPWVRCLRRGKAQFLQDANGG